MADNDNDDFLKMNDYIAQYTFNRFNYQQSNKYWVGVNKFDEIPIYEQHALDNKLICNPAEAYSEEHYSLNEGSEIYMIVFKKKQIEEVYTIMFYETPEEAQFARLEDVVARQDVKYQAPVSAKIDQQKGDKNFLFSFTIKKGENQTMH